MSNDGGIGLLQRFEARMKASLRPIGIMHLTDEAAKTVAAKWGLRSEMNPNILLALWHRLKDEGVKSEFAKTECRALAFLSCRARTKTTRTFWEIPNFSGTASPSSRSTGIFSRCGCWSPHSSPDTP